MGISVVSHVYRICRHYGCAYRQRIALCDCLDFVFPVVAILGLHDGCAFPFEETLYPHDYVSHVEEFLGRGCAFLEDLHDHFDVVRNALCFCWLEQASDHRQVQSLDPRCLRFPRPAMPLSLASSLYLFCGSTKRQIVELNLISNYIR
jgi:hypothetical protein